MIKIDSRAFDYPRSFPLSFSKTSVICMVAFGVLLLLSCMEVPNSASELKAVINQKSSVFVKAEGDITSLFDLSVGRVKACPPLELAGMHTPYSPVYQSRRLELEALDNSKYRKLFKILETVAHDSGVAYSIPGDLIHTGDAADEIAERIFLEYISKYQSYGCNSDNIIEKTRDVEDSNRVSYHSLEDSQNSLSLSYAKGSREHACKTSSFSNKFCLPLGIVYIHEIMHVEERYSDAYLPELLPSLRTLILTDLVEKRRLNQKEDAIDNWTPVQIAGRTLALGDLIKVYRDLEKKYETLSAAILSPESISYLTGLDFRFLESLDPERLEFVLKNLKEIQELSAAFEMDVKDLKRVPLEILSTFLANDLLVKELLLKKIVSFKFLSRLTPAGLEYTLHSLKRGISIFEKEGVSLSELAHNPSVSSILLAHPNRVLFFLRHNIATLWGLCNLSPAVLEILFTSGEDYLPAASVLIEKGLFDFKSLTHLKPKELRRWLYTAESSVSAFRLGITKKIIATLSTQTLELIKEHESDIQKMLQKRSVKTNEITDDLVFKWIHEIQVKQFNEWMSLGKEESLDSVMIQKAPTGALEELAKAGVTQKMLSFFSEDELSLEAILTKYKNVIRLIENGIPFSSLVGMSETCLMDVLFDVDSIIEGFHLGIPLPWLFYSADKDLWGIKKHQSLLKVLIEEKFIEPQAITSDLLANLYHIGTTSELSSQFLVELRKGKIQIQDVLHHKLAVSARFPLETDSLFHQQLYSYFIKKYSCEKGSRLCVRSL